MSNITNQPVVTTLKTNYMPYAMQVIVARALPFVFDGLKPSHRKAMQTAHEMNISANRKTKSANLVGQTMKLNPHGDAAIYETIVRLTDCNGSLLVPLFSGKGNFGKIYSRDMAYAASRYTEIGLSPISREFFGLIDKDTVDFEPNYDGTKQEPKLLPVTFPNILVNPNQGIAVGMASSICSFNFEEVCKATIAVLQGAEDVSDFITGPDFPTGGTYLLNEKELKSVINTGKGSFKVRSKYTFDKANNCIEITEIPYTTKVEAIEDKITELIKLGKIKEITDVRDETDLNGLKLTIDIKRGTDPDELMKKLYSITPLEDTFSCNFNVLYNDEHGNTRPKVMGVNEILRTWCSWRLSCLVREYNYDLRQKTSELLLLQGLSKVVLDIDKAIEIIRSSDDDSAVVSDLMQHFAIDEKQAEYVANIRLRNLNNKYILEKTKHMDSLKDEISQINEVIANEDKQRMILVDQLNSLIKKYASPRKTDIGVDEGKISKDVLVPDYNCSFVLTQTGYFKKNSRYSENQKVKEGDKVIQTLSGTNKDDILLFTNKGNVYVIKAYEVDDCTPSSMGIFLPGVISLESEEHILYMAATTTYSGYMMFAFENGKFAKIPLVSYKAKTNRKKLANAYSLKSPLVKMLYLEKDTELVAMSTIGKVLVFDTNQINIRTTKSSEGVTVLKSKNNSKLKGLWFIHETMNSLAPEEIDYYRGNIFAIGTYIKGHHDWTKQQLTL